MSYKIQGRRLYVPFRGLVSIISLILAVWYSHDLGVVNRSYLAVIMVTCSLNIIAFTSGTTLTLRAYKSHKLEKSIKTSFSTCIILELVFSVSIFISTLGIFSAIKESLPINLVMIAILYFITAFFHTVLIEYLLASDKFLTAAKLEFLTVSLQVILFFSLKNFFSFSTASSVLIAFALSYFSVCSLIVRTFASDGYIGISSPIEFWVLTRGKHMFGAVIGILDRLDRVLVAFLLPTINLGQYATMGSLISFFRFVPEAFSKIVISGPIQTKFKSAFSKLTSVVIAIVLIGLAILISRLLIEKVLGPEWLLSIPIYLSYTIYEIMRGIFHVSYNSRLAKTSAPNSSILKALFLVCLGVSAILSNLIGLIGIPLTFGIAYMFGLGALRNGKLL